MNFTAFPQMSRCECQVSPVYGLFLSGLSPGKLWQLRMPLGSPVPQEPSLQQFTLSQEIPLVSVTFCFPSNCAEETASDD